MTQILNVPMPADEAIKIIRSIFESNKMIEVVITSWPRMVRLECIDDMYDEVWECFFCELVTITAITPIIPKYEVGDEVMILATGEIGEIVRQDRQYARDCYIAFPDEKIWHRWENFHRSEICKIA